MAETEMGSGMDAEMDIGTLTEELTVQNVILDSIQPDTSEDAEAERELARAEIERLKKLLRIAKQKELQTAVVAATVDEPHAAQHAAGPSTESPLPNGNISPLPYEADIWGDPGSQSLPSRKRTVDSSYLSPPTARVKSQRTTPAAANDPFASSPTSNNVANDVDFIDLTGDDEDDFTTDFISRQRAAEEAQKRELSDHEFAKLVSSQRSPSPTAFASQSEPNAFTRIMNSQLPMSNGPLAATDDDDDDDDLPEYSDIPATRIDQFASPQMPGSYNSSWDIPTTQTPNPPFHRPPVRPTPGGYHPVSAMSGTPGTPVPYAHGARVRQFTPQTPVVPSHHPSPSYPFGPGRLATPMAFPTTPSGPWGLLPQNNPGLAGIINQTSSFDYASGLDALGNPLPERVTDFLQDAFHDPRLTEKDLDNLLKNIRPDMDIPERNRDGTPAGLKRPLYPHQEVALTWMKKMEEGTNKGGILADDMGLGKTISTLALLVSRRATTRPKTNLIVGPVALIRQWEEEIKSKTKLSHALTVFIYHNRKASTDDLLNHDVVLTTYGTVAAELKRLEKFLKDNEDRNIDYNDRSLAVKCPLLHPKKAKFYRVILDEAQCIKNKSTQTAKACTQLKATYRWCLTGTPMMNGVLELYSLLNFLQIKPYNIWEEFRQKFGVLFGRNGDPKSVAMNRLRALLKAIMLRRKKNSELDGKPILKLPEKTEEVVYAELSPDEHDFYAQLEKKSQVLFNKYLREGSVGKNYSSILVLLLRLRQACCHPHLNLDVDDAVATTLSDEEKTKLVQALDSATVERIKAISAFECPICYDAVQCPMFFIPCGHDSCSECLSRLTENAAQQNLQEGSESSQAKCPVCRGRFEPGKSFSYAMFQKVFMPERLADVEGEAESSGDDEEEQSSESEYGSDDEVDSKGNLRGFIVDDESSSRRKKKHGKRHKLKKLGDSADHSADRPGKAKGNGKGKKKASDIKPSMLKTLRKEAYKNRDAFKKYMRYLRKTWLPSAKVTECLNLLKTIQESGEKTIIFSQWTLLLDLLEVAMHHEGMDKPQRYDGSMTADQRNAAAHLFRDPKGGMDVMLVSLRAGNAGLNLTAASRVIIMDPFWNPYIEMQAVDRAYRIGQQREVKVYRVLTKGTVEDRIVELQERKKEMVEAALDESESVKIGRLSVNELKFLFFSRD